MSSVGHHIFREYDVRGVVDEDLTAELAERLGRAYGSEVRDMLGTGAPHVALGYDNRLSSEDLAEAFASGLSASGARVSAVGCVPTPALYFAVHHLGCEAGIQVTGSHNPPEYNGFKMLTSRGPFYGPAIQRLRERIEGENFARGEGGVETVPILSQYVDDVAGRFELARPVDVVIDCGNGTGSLVATQLLERIGARVDALYCDSDGTFPNHHPDPTVDENLADLIDRVQTSEAALGIALDGDADRIGAVDERGAIVRGDYLLLVYALDALKGAPGAQVIFDVKCSQVLADSITEAGGRPIMWKTGHSLIKEKMRESGARIAGEMSGHMFFADDYYGYDDALYSACRLVDIVARADDGLSSLLSEIPTLASTPEIRVECDEDQKFEIVARAVEYFKRRYDVIDVDGARIEMEGGWALIRSSNTQPIIVLRFEAENEERLAEIRQEVADWLADQGVEI
ncbi:MAG: phosphomannomutase/phosphoglucomutase [Gemmatimonadetes bacterium]|uniref:Phosphomannomutase/phosphoglucomutase n=1 Tax=Candidatus Kutchimonas denitrificans TaxID=3056748 RepID=A0AAE4ZCJ1_9BACT|nr:phosphomannomutase/phosphoglucomutase [Gemmatimonadota bacterium]NIR75220.1 phosphomannomutase/phosphoglucomutase [Candidatus Kutchimonas denitrificans]NIS00158.1 phosphomannomutase/phosphoglucomutase [Gemmatimonadota bacterium]NIT65750.1 phosphomannomutase/phosphoglucomutase [Gemmatimonadota bacterium]NIU53028.1 phosphomannomutase [Gemmatimonadota bacterium]